MDDYVLHSGVKFKSGRYQHGWGEDPHQHCGDFLGSVERLSKQGLTDTEIAKGMGLTTRELRERRAIAREEQQAARSSQAYRLKEKGWSNVAIAERMGVSEGTVRNLLKSHEDVKTTSIKNVSDAIKSSVDELKYVDIGAGSESWLGVNRSRFNSAVRQLEDEGYNRYYIPYTPVGTKERRWFSVLAAPDVSYAEVSRNRDNIGVINWHTEDDGLTMNKREPIQSIDHKRIMVRYAEDGGKDKDGVIEIRRGAEDLSLGNARYAQVRIGVDGTHYLKGMAMYTDEKLPDGIDIVFNTNKHKGTPMIDSDPKASQVLKPMDSDEEASNPFGATIKSESQLSLTQRFYTDKNGKRKLSPVNVVNEEGDWGEWSRTISSQMLSKQAPKLAKRQLDQYDNGKREELDEILSLNNPVVKRRLLQSFADQCDSDASHLTAAGFPRQRWHVILPFTDIKDNEIYAPNYNDGERVVLIRYPHGGIFEIPELTVNNRSKTAKRVLGNAPDAVGISAKVAERLSGADFDGDTVIVIPNNRGEIKSRPALKQLKDFDPKESYPAYPGMKRVKDDKSFRKQFEMGKVSNLITDMTIKGADFDEIARAVKHSMVVIDAEKHNLNWRQSYIDNGIAELKERYQGSERSGASTIISKASSTERVPHRREISPDPVTGERRYVTTGRTYTNKQGKVLPVTIESTKMRERRDARTLSSGEVIEEVYAEHANRLKGMANEARRAMVNEPSIPYSPSARKTYQPEYDALVSRLRVAQKSLPLERKAQILAAEEIRLKRQDNPDMTREEVRKYSTRAIIKARSRLGSKKNQIYISDREWEAIQAGAFSNDLLTQIIENSDLDRVRELATPRKDSGLNTSQLVRARSLIASGRTYAEIADILGVSVSTLNRGLYS